MHVLTHLTFALLFGASVFSSDAHAQSGALKWEPVTAQVPTGNNVRLDVRLIGADGKPVAGKITVVSTRFDMGPDKMEMRTAPVRPAVSSQAGVVSFDANVMAPGHWALTVSANIAGQAQPVTGKVVFTAVRP